MAVNLEFDHGGPPRPEVPHASCQELDIVMPRKRARKPETCLCGRAGRFAEVSHNEA